MSGWTDDRTEACKKLWSDGLSASQIARRLGGITRNAVIGKVHRLGLAAREPRAKPRFSEARVLTLFPPTRLQLNTPPGSRGNRKNVARPRKISQVRVETMEIPAALRVDLLDLRDNMCRWPIGDPKKDGFHFCGRQRRTGDAYCCHHEVVARKPTPRRRVW